LNETRACKKQQLNDNSKYNPKVDKAINKTINKAIGAAVTSLGDIPNMINKATNKAIVHVVTAATGSFTESIVGDDKDNNPDCSLNKTLIFSNTVGGIAGGAASVAIINKNPCVIGSGAVFGGIGGFVDGINKAREEQNSCIDTKEKEAHAKTQYKP
jgi:hypothetical protein